MSAKRVADEMQDWSQSQSQSQSQRQSWELDYAEVQVWHKYRDRLEKAGKIGEGLEILLQSLKAREASLRMHVTIENGMRERLGYPIKVDEMVMREIEKIGLMIAQMEAGLGPRTRIRQS
ncbi:MAG: hypothetical protein ACYCOU_06350 [Sulfobacillus sp.]